MLHGDFWFNNMLFRYADDDGETPVACSVIDLAIGFHGSPAIDLVYFLYMSTTPMLRKTHLGTIHKGRLQNFGNSDPLPPFLLLSGNPRNLPDSALVICPDPPFPLRANILYD